ncbi:Ig-like domain-containing protein [Chitinophaga sp. MM2321]|uniref:Ig-like domain-containing protein n=1 Tax=Chitinophaga sp. MM2321 TaxID=3137178 RepID=UPI0032D56EAC
MKNTFTKLISRLLLMLCFLFTGYQGFAHYTATTIATGGAYGPIVRLVPPASLVNAVTRLNTTPTAGTSVNYSVVFDQAVTGVTISSFSLVTSGAITGAAVTAVSGSGTTYNVTVNNGTGDGTLRLDVAGTGVTPAPINVPYTAGAAYTIDKTSPTGSIVINSGASVTNNATATLTLAATDVTTMQMRFSNDGSTWSGYEPLAPGKSWPLTAGDGLKTVYVQYQDAALNVQGYSATITLDQTDPVATILTGPDNPVNSTSATFTFSSDEAGSTFQGSLDGGSDVAISSPATMSGIAAGAHTISIRATDPAGNVSTPATYNWVIDLTAPTVTSVAPPAVGDYGIGSPMNFVVNYSENVIVNTAGGTPYINIILTSGTVKAYYISGSGTSALTFSYAVVEGDAEPSGPAFGTTLQLNGGIIRDAASNDADVILQNTGNTSGRIVNTIRPTVTLTTTEAADVSYSITTVITFSEEVYGFTKSDLIPVNAIVTSLVTSDGFTFYAELTPIAEGPVQLNIPAAVAANLIGNPNKASTNTLTFNYDVTSPVVTSVDVPADGYYKAGDILNFTVHFNETVIRDGGSGNQYLALMGGGSVIIAPLSSATSNSLTFSYTVVNGDYGGVLVLSLAVISNTLRDAAGNNVTSALNNVGNTSNVLLNTRHPYVDLSTTAPANVNAPFTVTITFSEVVTGFTIGDITTTNATLSNLQTTDNRIFTVLVTPTADGTVSLNVAADVAQNIGLNGNTAAAQLSVLYDITSPVVSAVSVPANDYYVAGNNMDFTVTFDGLVSINTGGGDPSLNITIGSSVVQGAFLSKTASSLTFRYTVMDGDQDMDGIAVNSLVLNGSTIKDAAGNNATLTLNGVGSTSNVFVNTTHPSVVLSTGTANVNAPFTATIAFSEVVTGFTMGDITATNATLSTLQTSDNTTYTVLVTPVADGAVSLNIAADVAQNIGLNGNTAAVQLNVLYDATPPAVIAVSVPADGYYVAGSNMEFTVTFDGPVNINTAGGAPSLNITIGSSVVQGEFLSTTASSITFRYTVVDGDQDMDGITVNSLVSNGSTIKDAADNNATLALNSVGSTSNVLVNTTHPSVVLSTTAPANANTAFTATIAFSEVVTGFTITDITTTNATLSSLQTTDNITYTVLVTPTADGDVSLTVAANIAINIADNANTSSNTIHVMYDITAPVVSTVDVPANGYYKTGATINFTVNYSENVVVDVTGGTPYLNVVLADHTVYAGYAGGNGTNALTFSYTVLPGDLDMDGPGLGTSLQTNGGIIRDAATNDADVTLQHIANLTGVFINGISPAVVLSTTAPALVNHAITGTIIFTEAVTGLVTGDFIATNATLSNLQTADDITYTVLVTPVADGAVNFSVPAAVAQNVADNNNTASNIVSFTYDGTAPVVSSVAVPANGYYKAATTLNFTVNFDENIILNKAGGTPYINVTIGATGIQAACTGTSGPAALTFSYTVQDGDMDIDGITIGSLVLNGGAIKDAAANDAILTLNNVPGTAGVFVNTSYPSVLLSTTTALFVNAPFTATITFSEVVTGFVIGDIVTYNATLSNLQTADDIIYTVLVTPVADGPVNVSVAAAVAQNVAGNDNIASGTKSFMYDRISPVVTSVAVPAGGYYKAATQLGFTVNFDENIILNTTGGTPYINVTIGASVVQAVCTGASGPAALTFSYTVQDGDMDIDGITVGSLVLNGGSIKDAAANDAILTLNNMPGTAGVFVNTSYPSVVLSTTAAATVNAPFTAMITFSEVVTGFVMGDIVASNATLSNLQTTDDITYTVSVTPVTDGLVSINVPAAVAVNIGDNDNTASAGLSITYDVTAPVVTSVAVPADGYYKDGNTLSFVVNYNENVVVNPATGVPYINLVLATGTVKATYASGSGTPALVFSYTVKPGNMDMDGISLGSLVLDGGTIKDISTNNAVLTLNNVAPTTGVSVNTATPSVVLSTTAAARINTTFDVKIVFSEAVSGMVAADLNITNGTAANLQTTDNITYTATITPTTDGIVQVYIPAGQAENVVTNTNTISNTVSLVYDITAPVINANQTFNKPEISPVGTLIGTVTAMETAGTLQGWTITGDDSGGAFSIDNTGQILVKDAAILNSNDNATVHLTITVSDGLNTSSGASVAIIISLANKAPELDAITSAVMCANTDVQTIQLTGASAVETDQTYSFSIMTDQPYFDALAVSATGLVTYQLKAGATGMATITVTIKDDGGTSNGGVDSLRRSFTVTANSLPVISISSDKGATISKGDIIHLTATGGNRYSWAAADGNISGEQSDILEARPMNTTTYNVTVTSAANCFDTANFTVKVIEDFKVDAINILSPNGDGKNDKWVIRNIDSYPNNEVRIYDRTGKMVYSRRNYNNEWDATMNGSPLAEGTYYYILTAAGGKIAKGYITIIRDAY